MVAEGLNVLVNGQNRKLGDVRSCRIPARRRPTLLKDVVIAMRKTRGKIEKKG